MSDVQVNAQQIANLKVTLSRFLEAHLGTKIVEPNEGALKMMIMHAKNQNQKIKDKFINWKLGEVSKRLLESKSGMLSYRDYIICEYLLDELNKYVASKLK
jgi:hypothetical protein